MTDHLRVSNLIDNGAWRLDLLSVILCPRDREIISNISLCPTGGQDIIIWHYTRHGRFTVSSAYRLGFQQLMVTAASSSAAN